MTTTPDTRPPLYLTELESKNYFSTHGADIGREIIIVEDPVKGCSEEELAAWSGIGRWEAGLTGGLSDFPSRTFFAAELLAHPPHWLKRQGVYVRITTRNGTALYRLMGLPHQNPILRRFLETVGNGRRVATLVRRTAA